MHDSEPKVAGDPVASEPGVATNLQAMLDEPTSDVLRDIYLRAFELIRPHSLTRIVMTDDEWRHSVMSDPDNVKIVGTVDGRLGGLLVVTNRPDRIDWLEPEFLRTRFAADLEARRLWYVLTICVDPELPRTGLFRELIRAFLDLIEGDRALYDTCAANTHLTRVITEELSRRGIDTTALETPVDTEIFRTVEILR